MAAVVLPLSVSHADSISPSSYSDTLAIGESVTIRKTVTVDSGSPTTSKVDVVFLADNTGSMYNAINTIKAAAGSILTTASGLGDVHFSVGRYIGEAGTSSYQLITQMTGNQAAVQSGINSWYASGGGDTPEANLYALERTAEVTNWRTGSERILVWFGDAVGHDPSPGGSTPATGKVTEAQAIAALTNKGINVQAIDTGSSGSYYSLDGTGQATRITNATGGTLYSSINSGSIVSTINNAISSSIATYTTVGLDTSEVLAGVGVSVTPIPGAHVGSFDRSITRTFDFDVTFTGVAAGTHDFNIYGTVDGGRVATETDHIVVRTPTGVPDSSSTFALLGGALFLVVAIRRKAA